MKCLAFAILATLTAPAFADTIYATEDERGRISAVERGVFQVDVGGLVVLSRDQEGDMATTRMSSDFSLTPQYYVARNISLGVALLFDHERSGGGIRATTGGIALQGAMNIRLFGGAFFRPALGLGGLYGSRKSPSGSVGMLAESNQAGFITRLQLPIAYYTNRRWVLEAGPQLNLVVGSYTPIAGGGSTSFQRVAGGFAVGLGRAF